MRHGEFVDAKMRNEELLPCGREFVEAKPRLTEKIFRYFDIAIFRYNDITTGAHVDDFLDFLDFLEGEALRTIKIKN